jgi:hypothetical protein
MDEGLIEGVEKGNRFVDSMEKYYRFPVSSSQFTYLSPLNNNSLAELAIVVYTHRVPLEH